MVDITVEFNSKVPIYIQIYEQIKDLAYSGKLKPGDSVPSSRALAGLLEINYHTVNQAYQALWKDGLLKMERGKRYVIAKGKPENEVYSEIEEEGREMINRALMAGLTEDELMNLMKRILKGKNGGAGNHA
ncbi:MAG: GntR family transcriptional regulator [Candidatus Thermoplasmatota archaeon]|jgi:GntR family transcriptional regulator|nr:GntR family transcriptional regulator [Candidatus Thermoplasmatota archaeon]